MDPFQFNKQEKKSSKIEGVYAWRHEASLRCPKKKNGTASLGRLVAETFLNVLQKRASFSVNISCALTLMDLIVMFS
jgi:hypothetical protein